MGKIKILQINKLYYPEIGGIEKTLQQISEGLSKDPAVDLKVLVCQKKGKGKIDDVNGVEIHRAGSLGVVASVPISFSFIWKLRKMAKGMDVIQFHLPFPLGDLACLMSGYRGKVVAYWHSDVVKQKKWMFFYRPVMERFLKRADVILVGAEGILNGSQYLKPYKEKCKVVPFAVSDEILKSGTNYLQRSNKIQTDKRVLNFLFIGRLVYYKGCSVLVEAFAKIGKKAELVIIGDGGMKKALQQHTELLGVADRIHFLGHLDDEELRMNLEKADVFVFPSVERSEAFGLVQLEAMAYGIPVINTKLPSGVPEVSVDGETGLTVAPGDVNELVEAMCWMQEHEEERILMGQRARKRVEQYYTQDILIENIYGIYRGLLEDRECESGI